MFTGIIEKTGLVTEVIAAGSNKTFWIQSPLWQELKPDQSVSHNGVCLTVEEVKDTIHRVTAVEETLQKTNADHWKTGDIINLERSLTLNARIDGHLVQGHVDCMATCTAIQEKEGSWLFTFKYPEKFATLLVEKGSVAVNGTSLTAFDVTVDSFNITIIPYTWQFTNFNRLRQGDHVNIEFDMIGKYVMRNEVLKQVAKNQINN